MENVLMALTTWQPWASMLACGAKHYETRGWPTKYRGPVAIHAAMKPLRQNKALSDSKLREIVQSEIDAGCCPVWDDMPLGKIIAVADLVNVWHIVYNVGMRGKVVQRIPVVAESLTVDKHDPHFDDFFAPTEKEKALGDWTPGRYAWEFANIRLLPEPIPARGQQGLWTYAGNIPLLGVEGRSPLC